VMCDGDCLQLLFDYMILKALDFRYLILKTYDINSCYILESKTNKHFFNSILNSLNMRPGMHVSRALSWAVQESRLCPSGHS
jgi:hypothetical protein